MNSYDSGMCICLSPYCTTSSSLQKHFVSIQPPLVNSHLVIKSKGNLLISNHPSPPSFCCRIFGGLILDVKRKAPWYWSDFKDAINLQCLASFLFLYCACMSPVITFGGLLGEATEGQIVRTFFPSFHVLWIVLRQTQGKTVALQRAGVISFHCCWSLLEEHVVLFGINKSSIFSSWSQTSCCCNQHPIFGADI